MVNIDVKANVLKTFYPVYTSTKPNIVLVGGRASTKTSETALELLIDFLNFPMGNVIGFRKYQNTLLISMYYAIQEQIYKFGLQDDFKFVPSRLKIVDKANGTGFYFFGMDDVNKIKSAQIPIGIPFRYWFEEFQENEKVSELEIIEDIIVTFVRKKLPKDQFHQVRYTMNRPRSPYALVNVWYDKIKYDSDYFCHESNYLDVINDEIGKDWLSEDIIRRINKAKERDLRTYEWRYLGLPVGETTKIYDTSLFEQLSLRELFDRGEYIVEYDIVADTGYQVSATAYQAYGITNKLNPVLIDTWYYSPLDKIRDRMPVDIYRLIRVATRVEEKLAPSDLSKRLNDFGIEVATFLNDFAKKRYIRKPQLDREIIDSAEGGLKVQYFNDYGRHLKSVRKRKKYQMIELSRTVTAEKDFYVLTDNQSNQVFMWENEKYQWQEDSIDVSPEKAQVVKIDDHTCDTRQYWSIESLNKLGLE